MKAKKDFDYYIAAAQKAEDKSVGLWKGMNQIIRSVLEGQRKKGTPLSGIPAILEYIAGPKKKRQGDMVSIENIRIAARQIRARKNLVLI